MSRPRTKLAAVAAVAAVALSGCAGLRPGTAARLGDDRISMDRVDAFASALCAYNAQNPQAGTAAETRRLALWLLVRADLAQSYAADYRGRIAPADIDRVLRESIAPAVESLPQDEREDFLAEVRGSLLGDQLVTEAAQDIVRAEGEQPDDQNVGEARDELYANWAQDAGVEIDPRFGTWEDFDVERANGSLSVPADAEAAPDAALPGGRRCGA